jgi:choline-phosphate cytidylyltransferase
VATGKFLPTRRTPGISTSDLLSRIVSGYRHRDFDLKLEKMGRGELKAEGSDYDWSSREISRDVSRAASPHPRPTHANAHAGAGGSPLKKEPAAAAGGE